MFCTEADIIQAIHAAAKGRESRRDFRDLLMHENEVAAKLCADIVSGEYVNHLHYTTKNKTNNNGKTRHILSPDAYTLIMQHVAIAAVAPYYKRADNGVGLNCKVGCGITAKRRQRSVNKRLKHIFYDCRDYTHCLIIDQRQCYAHITRKIARRALKAIGVERGVNDFMLNVAFVGKQFPIGTPTSPLLHHIIMLPTDKLLRELSPLAVRYADDSFMAFQCAEDAQRAKWRLKNLWWYTLGMRAKRHTTRIAPLSEPIDFCGNVYRRNPDKEVCDHNKGYVRVRQTTADHALHSTARTYPSYFGLLKAVDGYALMKQIEQDMNLQQLTDKIKIENDFAAPVIDIRELCEKGTVFCLEKYDVKFDKDRRTPNWVRCLITLQPDEHGVREVREFFGSLEYIAKFLHICEQQLGGKDAFLPLENCVIDKHGPYIFRGSLRLLLQQTADGEFLTN